MTQATGSKLRVVVLVSGTGSLLASLLAATAADYPATVVAVGADRTNIRGLDIAAAAGLPTFSCRPADYPDRAAWDQAITDEVAAHQPDLVVSAGFMKLLGTTFLKTFKDQVINTHPALSPAFPGAHAVVDAIEYGVKVTGCTVFFVDEGVDSGPIVSQRAVPVLDGDTPETLHERIKLDEREMLVSVVAALGRHGWRIAGRKVIIG